VLNLTLGVRSIFDCARQALNAVKPPAALECISGPPLTGIKESGNLIAKEPIPMGV
jgi:hypothetical protein